MGNVASQSTNSDAAVTTIAARILMDMRITPMDKEKRARKDASIFLTLPGELLLKILQVCETQDLASLCLASRACYETAMPFLYRDFSAPRTDHVLQLKHNLESGFRLIDVESDLMKRLRGKIRSIDLPLRDFKPKETTTYEEYVVLVDSVRQAIAAIVMRTQNLHTFSSHPYLESSRSDVMWQTLSLRPLQALRLNALEFAVHPYLVQSLRTPISPALWSMSNLSILQVTWSTGLTEMEDIEVFCRLLRQSPNLQDLSLTYLGNNKLKVKCFFLCQTRILSSLRTLQFLGVPYDTELLLDFLASLPKLKKVNIWESLSKDAEDRKGRRTISRGSVRLPSLIFLDVHDPSIAIPILRQSRPTVVHNMKIGSLNDESARLLTEALRSCISIKELVMSIADRQALKAVLHSVPGSVRRLAFTLAPTSPDRDSTIPLLYTETGDDEDYCTALVHLQKLERLVLPFSLINTNHDLDPNEDASLATPITNKSKVAEEVEKRAVDTAFILLALPHLEYIFFQDEIPLDKTKLFDIGEERWTVRKVHIPTMYAEMHRRFATQSLEEVCARDMPDGSIVEAKVIARKDL